MTIFKKPGLTLNIDDPEQKELYDFLSYLPNGSKRNTSSFLKMLVDREYQKQREEYQAKKKLSLNEKKTPEAPIVVPVKSENGAIIFKWETH